ncbi:MAG TPA: MarR family winged helix-turn-helix transcriptional regulator [Candidatus Dormibacteraeota bacterium]|nr:MarR family winged helix-turn-helix transcriptional regulator [Candidatus Dormibacteraeota bacterium]
MRSSKNDVLLSRYRTAVEACAVMNLRQASRVVTGFFDHELRPAGLRATQLNILMAIEVTAPRSVSAIADILATDRTTMTRNLQLLRKRGLIDEDRLALTAKGRGAAAAALPLWERAQATVVDTLGGERWAKLLTELAATKAAVTRRRRS